MADTPTRSVPYVVHVDDVEEHQGRYPPPFDAEGLSFGKDLGKAAGSRTLGAWFERLEPGCRTSRLHAHLREEELVWVASGSPTLRYRDPDGVHTHPLRAGHLVSLPAGTAIAHTFENHSDTDALLLVVGERRPGERIAYPEDPDFEAWREQSGSGRRWLDSETPSVQARPPAWRIETERLVLRPWDRHETYAMPSLIQRERDHLLPYMAWARDDQNVDHFIDLVRNWTRDHGGVDTVFRIGLPDGTFVGSVGMHDRVGAGATEIGYWVARAHAGHGYITEAVAAVCRVGFEIDGLERIEIHCDVTNSRSAAIPTRLGFTLDGVLRQRILDGNGNKVDEKIFSLMRSEADDRVFGGAMSAWDYAGRRLR